MEGEEYTTMMQKFRNDPSSFVKVDHPVYGVCLFKIDSSIREDLDCKDCLNEIVSACNDLTFSCPSSPPRAANPKWRKPIKTKKGSLKPSKPLTDKERELLFGNQSLSSDQEKVTTKKTKKTMKKNKRKAPNATRKTKKPTRL